jgi:hypothetical protein
MASASCVTNFSFIFYLVCFIQCVENCRQTCSAYSDYLLNYRNFIALVIALEVFSGSKEVGW